MTDRQLLIYVAGPYSAPTEEGRVQNVENAMSVGQAIIERGHWPLIPHVSHYFDVYTGGKYDYETYIEWSLVLVAHCDALFYLSPSPGADRELALARERGLPIFNSLGELSHG